LSNPFVLPKDAYQRDIHPIKHYITQAASYLSKSTNQDFQACYNYVKTQIQSGGQFEFKDPIIHHTVRIDYEDRVETQSTVMEYIYDSIKNKELIAPTLTTYVNPKEKESLLVGFIDNNVKNRSGAKKKMFAATVAQLRAERRLKVAKEKDNKEDELHFLEEVEKQGQEVKIQNSTQSNKKISNNSLSGAHVSSSTPLFNRTAHSTLTSTCRATSGYGNANNEKFVAGNRHYHSYDVTLNNIVSIVSNTDYDVLAQALDQYGIKEPTVQETMQCIMRSTVFYWREQRLLKRIENYLHKLSGLERAAFVYTGDFYHLRKLNDTVVRTFLSRLSRKVEHTDSDPLVIYKNSREELHHLASQICDSLMKGVGIKDAFDIQKDEDDNPILNEEGQPILADPERAMVMAATIENIEKTLEDYTLFIKAFWMTRNFPASVSYLPSMVRRVVLISDTDSTIFTVQDWIEWYFGSIYFDEKTLGMCATVVFLASQTITHLLAMMSANFGIGKERIHQVAMKNEYRFDVFVPTTIGKHYYALIGCREGNLYNKYKKEIKGVHLKSSNAPKQIMESAQTLMVDKIMKEIIKGNKISLDKILKEVSDIERHVVSSIKQGSYEYLRLTQIKEDESYTLDANQSPYQHYTLWNEVFGPKYGFVPPPPYVAIKVSTVLDSKKKMQAWLETLEDKPLVTRMQDWLIKNEKKNGIGTFQLPDQILSSQGFPEEIFQALDTRRIVLDATGVFYIILETLGMYMLDKKKTKLFSDYY